MVQRSNPGGGVRFSTSVQYGPGAHPASYMMDTGSFLGVKRPGHDACFVVPSPCLSVTVTICLHFHFLVCRPDMGGIVFCFFLFICGRAKCLSREHCVGSSARVYALCCSSSLQKYRVSLSLEAPNYCLCIQSNSRVSYS